MTARLLLVRHASHDLLGRVLCGRQTAVSINAAGFAQAQRLAETIAAQHPAAVYASPQARAQQTAGPIATTCSRALQTDEALDEIDFGDWTGSPFDRLAEDEKWKNWNTDRLHHRPPGGESMLEAQLRATRWMQNMATRHADQTIVAVSHSDLIKAACCHVLGLSIDFHDRFDIEPASITTLLVGEWGLKLVQLNETLKERS